RTTISKTRNTLNFARVEKRHAASAKNAANTNSAHKVLVGNTGRPEPLKSKANNAALAAESRARLQKMTQSKRFIFASPPQQNAGMPSPQQHSRHALAHAAFSQVTFSHAHLASRHRQRHSVHQSGGGGRRQWKRPRLRRTELRLDSASRGWREGAASAHLARCHGQSHSPGVARRESSRGGSESHRRQRPAAWLCAAG